MKLKERTDYNLMRILFFLREVRKDDIGLMLMRYSKNKDVRSRTMNRLLKNGFIQEEKFQNRYTTHVYSVIRPTEKGLTWFIDNSPEYYHENKGTFQSNAANAFNHFFTYRNRSQHERIHAANRVKAMMIAAGMPCLPDEKPSLNDFYTNCFVSIHKSEVHYPQPVKTVYLDQNWNPDSCRELLKQGVFYSTGEVMEFLDQKDLEGSDSNYSARMMGIFISRAKCVAIYTPTACTDRVIKLNKTAEENLLHKIKITMKNISMYERPIGKMGVRIGNVDAMVIANGESLTYSMATGHQYGKHTRRTGDEHKKDTANVVLVEQKDGKKLTESPVNHVAIELSEKPRDMFQAVTIRKKLEEIPEVFDVDLSENSKDVKITLDGRYTVFPRKEVAGILKDYGLKFKLKRMQQKVMFLNHTCSIYDRIFVVTPDSKGVESLRFFFLVTTEGYYEQYHKLVRLNPEFSYETDDPMNLNQAKLRKQITVLGHRYPSIENLPVSYMPVLEIKELHRMSVDMRGNTNPAYSVIVLNNSCDMISRSIRKYLIFFEMVHDPATNKIIGLQEIPDIPMYDPDGYEHGKPKPVKSDKPQRKPSKIQQTVYFDRKTLNRLKSMQDSENQTISDAIRVLSLKCEELLDIAQARGITVDELLAQLREGQS